MTTTATKLDALETAADAAAEPLAAPRRRRFTPQQLFVYLLLVAGAVLMMIPFVFLLSNSVKTEEEARKAADLLPQQVQWENYPKALEMMGMETVVLSLPAIGEIALPARFPALSNTIVITVLSVIGQVLSCSMVGFGFARYRFRGRDTMFMIMLATMMLPAQVTMIPVFLLFRSFGWIDTFWPLILPAWFGSPFFIFMFRQFFLQVPEELLEAARLDGASPWMIYWRIMLPLSTPVMAIVAIYTFMFTWNDFLAPLIYLNSPENRTLALELNAFSGQYGVQFKNLLMAASFVTMLPCVVLFFAAQRHFVSSAASSGLKG